MDIQIRKMGTIAAGKKCPIGYRMSIKAHTCVSGNNDHVFDAFNRSGWSIEDLIKHGYLIRHKEQ